MYTASIHGATLQDQCSASPLSTTLGEAIALTPGHLLVPFSVYIFSVLPW